MSYRRSRARREFEQQLGQTRVELTQLYPSAAKLPGSGGSRLLAAYYVFAFAQLEVFVKTVVEDALQAVQAAAPPLSNLPDLMVGYLIHRGDEVGAEYRRFATSEDEAALLGKVGSTARKVAAWNAGGPGIQLDSATFLDKKKYPSPRNMPQLFRRLGVRNLWAVASAAGSFNAELTLTSLNDLRTAIAHDGHVPNGFGMRDFRDRLDLMQDFVAAVDRCIADHFCSAAVTRLAWNRGMA